MKGHMFPGDRFACAWKGSERVDQRLWILYQVYEDDAAPGVDRNSPQPDPFGKLTTKVTSGNQGSIFPKRPTVISTDEVAAAAPRAVYDRSASVRADIDECA
jgi:hypothetical protein